jgi:ribosomal protein S6E (S10)
LAYTADAAGKPWDEVLAETISAYRPERNGERRDGQESFYQARRDLV